MSVIAEIKESLARISQENTAAHEYAEAFAVGVFADDPDPKNQSVVATFYEGRLFSLAISDTFAAELAPDDEGADLEVVGLLISAVIGNAHLAWTQDYERLREYADEKLRDDPNTITNREAWQPPPAAS